MRRARLMVLAATVSLTAAACAGTRGDQGRDATDRAGASAAESAGTTDLIAPTETDRPLDLSGRVRSVAAPDLVEVGDDPLAGLSDVVADAVAPWPTQWARRTIDLGELVLGIPTTDPRDRIRPIDAPTFEPIAAAAWLDEREPGALVQFEGEVRFYPLSILTRHEVVNDRFGDIPVVVTFCPLCNTAISFDARVDGQALRFGVSGLLRNSDLVMWDEATTSLWQQITGEAIVGDFAGTRLDLIPTAIVSYGDALENFPDARSLSQETGFGIEYGANPYLGYSSSPRPFLFDGELDPRFPALSRVVGVSLEGEDKAYPFSLVSDVGAVNDEVGGVPIVVWWGGDTADALDAGAIAEGEAIGTAIAFDRRVDGEALSFVRNGDDTFTDDETGSTWTLLGLATAGPLDGKQLETVQHRNEFWFAWASFFPDAAVYDGT